MSLFVDIQKKLGVFSLSVAFESDGILGILGSSGCGKSMTLKCIAGIEKPDSGRIVLNGVTLFDSERRINLPPQRRGVGYLFQNYSLFPNMTVRQNILCGMRGDRDYKALADILELMQLTGLENHRPSQLSGGQQQRTALARIWVSKPDLLMLDEPFNALDSHLRSRIQLQMQGLLRQFGRDVLLVTHSRNEAYRLCSRIALLDDGRLLTLNDSEKLFAAPESRKAAELTGCNNIVYARKTGAYEAEVPEWGVRLITAEPLRDELCAIGIHAHSFSPGAANIFPVRFTNEMQEPFESALQFRYEGQAEGSPDILWRIPKEKGGQRPLELGVEPADVLPLYL